jgi:polyphosphate kinase
VIQALYRASQAGVQIDLIVRGMCALVPGVRGVSDRIRVRSIVGRFLEHSRIFYFENGGDAEAWLGSADWMPRNLYDRVETLFPIRDPMMCQRLSDEILAAYLADTEKSRILLPDANYIRAYDAAPARSGKARFNAQEFLIQVAEGRHSAADIPGRRPLRRKASRRTIRAEK